MINIADVSRQIEAISMGEGCLVCQHSNPNWITEIQDVLDEIGVSAEQFAQQRSKHAGLLFEVRNGRLRVIDISQCVSPNEVIYMIAHC